jgi:hypothetical protein
MPEKIKVGSILIKENLSFPVGVTVDTDAYSPGWKLVRNLDGYGLARIIVKARWKFFYLAGEMRAIAFGSKSLGTVHRALKRILTKPEGQHYNALEITRVVAGRFFGVSFMRVAANFRRIQEGTGLTPTKDFILGTPGPIRNEKSATKRHTTMISTS